VEVSELMRTEVVTVGEDTPVGDILDLMTAARIHAVPVLSSAGELIGMVSQEDLLVGGLGTRGEAGGGSTTASDVMTAPPMAVNETSPVEDVARLMWEFRIHHVPVLREGTIVGIVSSLDYCRLTAGKMQTEP